MHFKDATEDINAHINKINDPMDILAGTVGPGSIMAVNHLQSSFDSNVKGIVSEYVAVSLTLKCDLRLVKIFTNHSDVRRNPALQGWVTELHFLATLRAASAMPKKLLSVTRIDCDIKEEWSVHGYQENFEPTEVSAKPEKDWLIPKKWNQGGYDFIQS